MIHWNISVNCPVSLFLGLKFCISECRSHLWIVIVRSRYFKWKIPPAIRDSHIFSKLIIYVYVGLLALLRPCNCHRFVDYPGRDLTGSSCSMHFTPLSSRLILLNLDRSSWVFSLNPYEAYFLRIRSHPFDSRQACVDRNLSGVAQTPVMNETADRLGRNTDCSIIPYMKKAKFEWATTRILQKWVIIWTTLWVIAMQVFRWKTTTLNTKEVSSENVF